MTPSPLRGGHGGARPPVEPDLAFVGVEVGYHAKKKAFAGSRRAGDGSTRAAADVQLERAGELAPQLFHAQRRLQRLSLFSARLRTR